MNQKGPDAIPIGLIAVVLFAVGLVLSRSIAGPLGMEPSVFWSSAVLGFMAVVFFIEHPKIYLIMMFLYFGFFLNGVLFGIYSVPIPFIRFLDELILVVPLAIIVMKAINNDLPKKATLFPFIYILLSVLSWRVNGVPPINFVRVVLAFFKFYIFWYFVRAIGPWSDRQKKAAVVLYVMFAALQFPANVLRQRSIAPAPLPDLCAGTVGSAHLVGYISVFALFFIAGWFLTREGRPLGLAKMLVLGTIVFFITYNLIFMTGTKHVLLMAPVAAAPLILFPRLKRQTKILVVMGLVFFSLASWFYFVHIAKTTRKELESYGRAMQRSGKRHVSQVVFKQLPREQWLYIPLGAGPGNFCSTVAIYSFRPLANRHVLPYIIKQLRGRGKAIESSLMGSPVTSLFTLVGEFGTIVTIAYVSFWFYIVRGLWRRAKETENVFTAGQQVALISCAMLIGMISLVWEILNIGVMIFPLWSMIGMFWDEEKTIEAGLDEEQELEASSPVRLFPLE